MGGNLIIGRISSSANFRFKWGVSYMKRIIRSLDIIKYINKIFYLLSGLSIYFIFLLMTSDVLGRYLFNSPIKGSSEIIPLFIVALAFLGLGHAQFLGRHVSINLLTIHLPKYVRKTLNIILLLLAGGFFIIMTIQIGRTAYHDFVNKIILTQSYTKLPIWWISFIAALGCALLVSSLLVQVVNKIFGTDEAEQD